MGLEYFFNTSGSICYLSTDFPCLDLLFTSCSFLLLLLLRCLLFPFFPISFIAVALGSLIQFFSYLLFPCSCLFSLISSFNSSLFFMCATVLGYLFLCYYFRVCPFLFCLILIFPFLAPFLVSGLFLLLFSAPLSFFITLNFLINPCHVIFLIDGSPIRKGLVLSRSVFPPGFLSLLLRAS